MFCPSYLRPAFVKNKKMFTAPIIIGAKCIKKNNQSLSAITGTAWSYSQMGRKASAQELIQTGLLISNRYKPLIQLKDSL